MAEKKVKGRKRHIVADTVGHILNVKVHAANIHDTVSGGEVFKCAVEKYPTILRRLSATLNSLKFFVDVLSCL